jgi:hypothetical protein
MRDYRQILAIGVAAIIVVAVGIFIYQYVSQPDTVAPGPAVTQQK